MMRSHSTIRRTYQVLVVCTIAMLATAPLLCLTQGNETSAHLLKAAVEDPAGQQAHDLDNDGFDFGLYMLPEQLEPLLSPQFDRHIADESVATESIPAATHLTRGPPLC